MEKGTVHFEGCVLLTTEGEETESDVCLAANNGLVETNPLLAELLLLEIVVRLRP